jgi:hypothetical protein
MVQRTERFLDTKLKRSESVCSLMLSRLVPVMLALAVSPTDKEAQK